MKDIILRPGQDKVLNYTGGFLALPSVPGAGKTFTLTVLTAKLIKEEMHLPGKILIVTYMNSAVNNFKDKIGKQLEKEGLPRKRGFEVMTLHSLAMKIIKEKPEALYLSEDFQPIDEMEQIRIIQREVSQWIDNHTELFQSYLNINPKDSSKKIRERTLRWADKGNQLAREMISYFKSHRISVEDIHDFKGYISQSSLLNMCFEVYEQYELYLKSMGNLDFDDLIVKSIDLVRKDKELRERLKETYTYIFEDEAQDSSILQEELLFLLSEDHKNLVRVGDINQSIMSTFTSSDPKLFRNFYTGKETEVSKILTSSRSSTDIIDMANYFVGWTRKEHPVIEARDSLEPQYIKPVDKNDPFKNPVTQGYTIGSLLAQTRDEEFRRIARSITKQLNKNKEKTMAVLLPSAYLMNEFMEILEEEKISYKEISSFPKERTRAAESLAAFMDYIAHPHDNKKLITALKFTLPQDIMDNIEIMEFLSSCDLEEILYPLGEKNWEITASGWSLVWESLKTIRTILDASFMEPEALILLLAESLHFDDNQMAIAQRIAGDIRHMIRINPGWGLGELAEQLKQIRNLYNYFANIVYERFDFEIEAGVVNLVTYHKSKGLEFDIVYLSCLTTDEFPSSLKDKFRSDYYFLKEQYKNPAALCKAEVDKIRGIDIKDPILKARLDVIQERLRLLYVGITRAKENLLLSTHKSYESNYGVRKILPSEYFNVLKKYMERCRANDERKSK